MSQATRINARAIIRQDGKVLVCRFLDKQAKYYFFPGGGVEFGEGVETALRRELQEELGAGVTTATFIGGVENFFDNDGQPYHELNLLFSVTIDTSNPHSAEVDYLAFSWMPVADLERENVLPKQLVAAVVQWLKDGQTFWVGLAAT